MRALLIAALVAAPSVTFAAGGDSTPPTPTKNTTECKNGKVWDETAAECVLPKESRLDDDTLYKAVREFAYAGAYSDAKIALAAMSDQNSDRVWTYRGFIARKTGQQARAMEFYMQALAVNPDNLLARSYMGQGFVEAGQIELAAAELTEIRTRGGRGSWPELSLRMAIDSGRGNNY